MPILNYTTTINAEKTVTLIQKILAKAGAKQILTEYNDEGVLSGISFRLMHNDMMVTFRLPANIDKIYIVLQRDDNVPRKLKSREQAARVAWRIIKDWIEAQIAIVEAEQAEMVEVFLPYAQNEKTGQTMYELMKSSDMKLLSRSVEGD